MLVKLYIYILYIHIYIWVFPKIGVRFPPKSSILIGISLIFTIHFGVPLFLEAPIYQLLPFVTFWFPKWRSRLKRPEKVTKMGPFTRSRLEEPGYYPQESLYKPYKYHGYTVRGTPNCPLKNPNDPCFGWKVGLVLENWPSTNRGHLGLGSRQSKYP